MLYAGEFEIDGLIATSNLQHGQKTRPDLIRQVVDAYAKVRPNLLKHDPRYPPAEALLRVIKAGQKRAGPKVPVDTSIGEGKDTGASRWIIEVVDRDDSRPVWVVIWGGSADLAQALWRVRHDRTPEELDRFLSRLRVHAIGDQDSTGPWIKKEFPASSSSRSDEPSEVCTGAATHAWSPRNGSRQTFTGTAHWEIFTPVIGVATSGPEDLGRSGVSRRGTRRRFSRWFPMACRPPRIPGWEAGAVASRARDRNGPILPTSTCIPRETRTLGCRRSIAGDQHFRRTSPPGLTGA